MTEQSPPRLHMQQVAATPPPHKRHRLFWWGIAAIPVSPMLTISMWVIWKQSSPATGATATAAGNEQYISLVRFIAAIGMAIAVIAIIRTLRSRRKKPDTEKS